MVKKIISVATSFLMLCCMIPFGAFANDVLDTCPKCGERTYETWQDFSTLVPDLGFPISLKRRHCTSCQYTYYDWNCMGYTGYKEFDSGSGNLIADYLKEWKDKTFGKNATAQIIDASNGGANIPAPGGRNPKGYEDEGKPNVNSSGASCIWVEPFGLVANYNYDGFRSSAPSNCVTGSSQSGTYWGGNAYVNAVCSAYYFTAPISGLYFVGSYGSPYDVGTFSAFCSNKWEMDYFTVEFTEPYKYSVSLKKGETCWFGLPFSTSFRAYGNPYKFSLNKIPIYIEPLGDSSITTTNNITINNNTWNGNIYTDNSTNLTYIYPQYTTINEKNETVTNISNTPIIYNNETKQYYTYDQTTKNYYYITYNAQPTPSPSPTPTPTDKPGGSISTPETGKPGGDTGDTTGILAVLVEIRDNMIQGFLDIKAAFVAGFAELSANFTLAIENLNVNIQNIFNKKFPDQSTPETALPSPTPSPSPAPLDPILPETQNLIIPKMNSNTFTDEHGAWIASGSSKYSDVFDFFHAFDRSTSDFWETNAKPSYLQIEIPDPESYYIDGYIMRISKFTNRYAKEWTLQGSDDGNTWDDLDAQKDQNLSDMEEYKYPLTLRKAYKYYRLNMSNYASSMCSLSVSAPTLYRYIQMGLFTQITYSHLPRAKKKKHKGKIHRQNKTNLNHRSIEMRCKAIMHRSDFGHWELDSVIGKAKGHGESVLVLTERKTRIEIILRPKDKTAAETTRCLRYLKHIFGRDYNKIFKTITCDNGSEFADQQAFESVGSMFFYCHPSCPSERGSNENANILIRRKLPKGQTMKKVTQKRATHIQHWLNDYPRHIFDGKTAFEMFMQELSAMNLHNQQRIVNFFDPHT